MRRPVSRLVNRPIQVHGLCGEIPQVFRDGGKWHRVDCVIDRWIEMGDWWADQGPRVVVRVLTEDQALFDLEFVDERWFIYRVWD
ncbi:hypothetical protein SAMN05421543_101360 [Alicyclobacillus macrosporangiidus]|uniref:Uncharacterized protein n=1 Tax=Alicyclobacillus macrosporangiidus TaxID=392015 RepID=A0A1I7FNE4_9BACL|nr:hypothetical protein SAMN05421543_101360 [Alicyclobacillus macrosporangiidus]